MSDKTKRGFASMNRDLQRHIASKGGKAAHEKRAAHEFTSDEARRAGRKGGRTVSMDRQHMAEIGRQGGLARRARAQGDGNGTPSKSSPDAIPMPPPASEAAASIHAM